MARLLVVGGLLLLTGCPGFEETRRGWNNYLNSPAAHQTTYSNTYTVNGQTTTCYTTCDRYDCATRCYGP
jgi:hypothetical protein